MEQATLTTPIVTSQTVTTYEIVGLTLQRGTALVPAWRFVVYYADSNGGSYMSERNGDEAMPLIKALNKANLSTKSLERRALEWLVAQNAIQGVTITGTPD